MPQRGIPSISVLRLRRHSYMGQDGRKQTAAQPLRHLVGTGPLAALRGGLLTAAAFRGVPLPLLGVSPMSLLTRRCCPPPDGIAMEGREGGIPQHIEAKNKKNNNPQPPSH